ncbi:MAG: hypothetical protein DCC67_02475 [Planctomycetota bacterium]|nr:MAG: hypothetical protein DCC67_02475 [Planctomycetota bacterium]
MYVFKPPFSKAAPLLAWLLAACLAGFPATAQASIATADASVSGTGSIEPYGDPFNEGLDSMQTPALGVYARGAHHGISPWSSLEYRGAVEFVIPTLPAGATLNSATLLVPMIAGSTNFGDFTIGIYGYAGNNAIDAADFSQTASLVGSQTWSPSGPITNASTMVSFVPSDISLDVTALVSSLVSNSDPYAGFLLASDSEPLGSLFAHLQSTITFAGAGYSLPPRLTLNFTPGGPINPRVPEATSVVAWLGLGSCGAAVALGRRRRPARGVVG